jgi:hypothetical protein
LLREKLTDYSECEFARERLDKANGGQLAAVCISIVGTTVSAARDCLFDQFLRNFIKPSLSLAEGRDVYTFCRLTGGCGRLPDRNMPIL